MPSLVSDAEAAFLAMLARRIVKHQREAEARGQTYNDLTRPYMLSCGHRAKIRPIATGTGWEPMVHIELKPGTDPSVAEQMARDILGGPAVLSPSLDVPPGGPYCYIRKA